jgi:hypothetical protein
MSGQFQLLHFLHQCTFHPHKLPSSQQFSFPKQSTSFSVFHFCRLRYDLCFIIHLSITQVIVDDKTICMMNCERCRRKNTKAFIWLKSVSSIALETLQTQSTSAATHSTDTCILHYETGKQVYISSSHLVGISSRYLRFRSRPADVMLTVIYICNIMLCLSETHVF